MQIGLVGAPSSGKSTFFNAATLLNAPMASYPFTTIEPNKGIGFVRVKCIDREFGVQCNPRTGYCKNGTRFVPIEIIDVAGLVPGASEGKGMGNQFLSDLSRADCLIHVVDASGGTNEKGESVGAEKFDPVNFVEFLEKEIDAWFFGIIKKNWVKFGKLSVDSKAKLLETMQQNLSGIGATQKTIETALNKSGLLEKKLFQWSEEDKETFATNLRQASKPIVIAANKIDLEGAQKNVGRIKEKFPHLPVFGCSAISELALKKAAKENAIDYMPGSDSFRQLKELDEKQKKGLEYIKTNVLEKHESTGVQHMLDAAVFEVLKFIAVFPAGSKLQDQHGNYIPDCYLLPPESTALDFAFRLHTDIGKGFIRAIDSKTKMVVGKEHKLKHRDAIEIVFKG
ncbi:MAG: redox-regulated ATPase YchF [Candidatus Diapherotrites archaeon]|nr:redox-regulated ATPase YchF [Candidatus Diapherotrites archaeon]